MDSVLIVFRPISQSKRGEGLEWQRSWTGTPYDKAGRKREDFVLQYAVRPDFLWEVQRCTYKVQRGVKWGRER